MGFIHEAYSVDDEITQFFQKTSTSRSECDARAKELVGGNVNPVVVQGVCSYSVYAGPKDEFVVQFRLKSLELRAETADLARDIYGPLVPTTTFKGQIGENVETKEPLYIYVMSRVQGVSHLDFILSHNVPENAPEWFAWRKNLIVDVARYIWLYLAFFDAHLMLYRFFALAWKAPQDIDQVRRDDLHRRYKRDLRLLQSSLPERFRHIIQHTLSILPAIFSLPMVLVHNDFGTCNIMVDSTTCHLVGVIDWAEAEIGPFGINFHSLQALVGKLHLKNGWIRYGDYDILQETFWAEFGAQVGSLSNETIRAIKSARTMGLLLSSGFTPRLANMPEPEPIRDDESGAYNMLYLDGLLLNSDTRFEDLA